MIDKIKTLVEESEDRENETDGTGDEVKETFQPILEEFEELIAENEDKNYFISRLIQIFTILLTKKVQQHRQTVKFNKNKRTNSNKTMARTKATVRRLQTFIPAQGERIYNKDIRRQINATVKMKKLLPQTKVVEVKANS